MTGPTTTCRCGRPTRDAAYVCDDCLNDLALALGEIPWVEEQVQITQTNAKGIDYRTLGATKSSETRMPYHPTASEALTNLKAVLVSWARFCDDEHVRNQSPHRGLPDDNLIAISRWLMWRIDGLGLHDIGPEAVDEITSAVAHCRRLIDRPADRQFLGLCAVCAATGGDGKLYGTPRSQTATCNTCGHTVNAEQLREKLLKDLDDRLCTAAEIARLSTYLGLKADREQVRKRINTWAKRGQLSEHTSFSDEPTFRFGAVYAMLAKAEYGGKKSA